MHFFYAPNITLPEYFLNEEESKHCINVLRLRNNALINLVDGEGGFYTAEIINAHPKKCAVKILESKLEYGKSKFHLHIAIAPPKNIQRFEWFLEKATEIGVSEITPLLCEFSEKKFMKMERLKKILISAMKQSEQAYLPVLNEQTKLKQVVNLPFAGQKFIAHCHNERKELIPHLYKKHKNVLVLIGPEGDFSPQEVAYALANSCSPISLGNHRLRTETAGIIACNVLNLLNDI